MNFPINPFAFRLFFYTLSELDDNLHPKFMAILVTGTSGFIGFHTAKKLLEQGEMVIGFDNENDYYSVVLKEDRRNLLLKYDNFIFYKDSLANTTVLEEIFQKHNPEKVIHLAAQAGVRYSISNPGAYIESNLVGFYNIIEFARKYGVKKFLYASSSSVYGKNEKQPFSVHDKVDQPMSLYAATKKSNELIAYSYSHLFGLPTIGIRFFTVYGEWGRPDMALMLFANGIVHGKDINVYNHGKMKRDFTYIFDVVDGILRALECNSRYEIVNLGNDSPVELEYLITLLEKNLGIKASKNYMDIQPGDVPATWADIDYTKELLGWIPKTSIEDGVLNFTNWYKEYFL